MATETVLDRHIVVTPGVAGGKPRVVGHRITVQDIVIWHEWMGLGAAEIAAEHHLALSDIYASLAYYYDHRDRIDQAIQADQAFVEELRRITPSRLPDRYSSLRYRLRPAASSHRRHRARADADLPDTGT